MTKHLAILSFLFVVIACVFVSADLVIRPGATLLVRSSIVLNGGDLDIEPGGTLNLEGGSVTNIGSVLLPDGSNLAGPGRLSLSNDWVNNSPFVRPVDAASEIIIDIPISIFESHAPGSGDTDGDGYTDHGEGTLDQDRDLVPDFLDPDALRMDRPPNSWLLSNGLPISLAPTVDSDGDGLSNLDEYHALTHPLDPDSVLRVTSLTRRLPGSFRIDWDAVEGKTYHLQASTNAVSDANYSILVSNITATGNAQSITMSVPGDVRGTLIRATAVP